MKLLKYQCLPFCPLLLLLLFFLYSSATHPASAKAVATDLIGNPYRPIKSEFCRINLIDSGGGGDGEGRFVCKEGAEMCEDGVLHGGDGGVAACVVVAGVGGHRRYSELAEKEGLSLTELAAFRAKTLPPSWFATEIFHDLHEEVMATATRGHGLMVHVQQLEAYFPSIEKALLSQTNHSLFFSNTGVDWHPNMCLEQNVIIRKVKKHMTKCKL